MLAVRTTEVILEILCAHKSKVVSARRQLAVIELRTKGRITKENQTKRCIVIQDAAFSCTWDDSEYRMEHRMELLKQNHSVDFCHRSCTSTSSKSANYIKT